VYRLLSGTRRAVRVPAALVIEGVPYASKALAVLEWLRYRWSSATNNCMLVADGSTVSAVPALIPFRRVSWRRCSCTSDWAARCRRCSRRSSVGRLNEHRHRGAIVWTTRRRRASPLIGDVSHGRRRRCPLRSACFQNPFHASAGRCRDVRIAGRIVWFALGVVA